MFEQGVIVGCDQKQEWLLPWWWDHYSCHNNYPVAFADFGMSPNALAWCKERGQCLTLPSSKIREENDISSLQKQQWEKRYGNGIWFFRSGWFKKPLALLHSPFPIGIWLDLDCQVNGSLDPIFNSLLFNAELSLVREPSFIQEHDEKKGFLLPGEVSYNSGVIAFRRNATILHHWVKEAIEYNEKYVGDQPALNRAIFLQKAAPVELPSEYNWPMVLGPNKEALIYHFSSGKGKIEILKNTRPNLLHLMKSLISE